jgi:hypothetical protein
MGSNRYRVCIHVHQPRLLVYDRSSFKAVSGTLRHPQHRSACHDYLCIRPCLRYVPVISIYRSHGLLIREFDLILAFGPLFLGPLSEIYGRSRVIQLSNLWYLSRFFASFPDGG